MAIESTSKLGKRTRAGACNGLKPIVSVGDAEEDALADEVQAAYKKKTGKSVRSVTFVNQCSLNAALQLERRFDAGGKADGDEPQLDATFEVKDGKPGDVVAVEYFD